MAPYVYWFLLALGLLALEMATGTFYLLMLSIALSLGGIAALLGLGVPAQLILSAVAGVAGIAILRRSKGARPARPDSQSLDIGQPVQVVAWRENGSARVNYRGAEWDAELASADTPREGPLYIKAMRSSMLILTHRK
ncbi:MAG: NfeD family protein [Sulfuricella sp.]|nr:NfeD family protein [Sulfuricella sp.]